jgi:PAS domain S-box-containing protein
MQSAPVQDRGIAKLMARALLAAALGAGLLLSALTAAFTLAAEFRAIEASATLIERIVAPQLSAMLWEFNSQTQEYLRSALYLPYVEGLELAADHDSLRLMPDDAAFGALERVYPLVHASGQDLGVLTVRFARRKAFIMAMRTALTLALVLVGALGAASFVQYKLLRRWIAEPLRALGESAGAISLDTLDRPLSLPRARVVAAELRNLAASLDGMKQKLRVSLGERDRLREELLKSEERYREVFDSAGDAILIHEGRSTRLVEANKAALSLFKTSEESLLGPDGFAAHLVGEAPYDEATALAQLDACVVRGSQLFEWRARDGEGRAFWVEVSLTAVYIRGRLQLISSIRDIDARKRAENQAFHLQRLDSVGRLAGGIAHDFNNTLQAILAECELGLLDAEPGGEVARSFNAVREAVHSSARLTRQLLTFARKGPSDPARIDLNESLASTYALLKRLLPEAIELVMSPAVEPLIVVIDPSHLDQVLTNLVVNARDAITDGGKIVVAARPIRLGAEDVQAHPELGPGEYALLEVADTGCGMAPEVVEHIFEPFYTTKPPDKGTGLGLSTVFGIVKQCGGSIQVYSEPGRGSSMKLFFPKAEGAVGPKAESAGPRRGGRGELIALVDDDPRISSGGERQLRALGYEVLAYDDPLRALEELSQMEGPPAALISDLVMPRMSGVELARRLGERFPGLPTLFVSGYPADLLPENYARPPLVKPFTTERLAEALAALLDGGVSV